MVAMIGLLAEVTDSPLGLGIATAHETTCG
jgi:hypothetical protein